MSARNFKFVSPGVVMEEIDRSLTAGDITADPGPVIIGRSATGPSMRPVQVNSYTDFIELFGNPVAGHSTTDTWRQGNYSSPTYAAYAAQAFLRSDAAPVTFIRTLGLANPSADDDGAAGWTTSGSATTSIATDGGAYGLFVMDSASVAVTNLSATLGAILYLDEGTPTLSGTFMNVLSTTETTGSTGLCQSVAGDNLSYRLSILDKDGEAPKVDNVVISLNPGKGNFIRNVLNTSPLLINGTTIADDDLQTYWLGESFEESVSSFITSSTTTYATLIPLQNADGTGREDMEKNFSYSSTGWFIGQDLSSDTGSYVPAAQQKLFKVEALDAGEWSQNNIKVSIEDLAFAADYDLRNDSKSGYGSFSLVVRTATDTDDAQSKLESFTNLSLNPASPDYIARRIGDKKTTWDQTLKRFVETGDYSNISKYIRVEPSAQLNDAISGLDARYLPYGVFGPVKPTDGTGVEASITGALVGQVASRKADIGSMDGMRTDYAVSVNLAFANMPLVASSTSSVTDAEIEDAYFGAVFDGGFSDYLRDLPSGVTETQQWVFSLDNVRLTSSAAGVAYTDYSSSFRVDGDSISASGSDGWISVIDVGATNFTAPLYGGFDGVEIKELDPFNNNLLGGTPTETNNYVFNTFQQTINMIKDPEVVEMNLATIPGLTNRALTGRLVDACEQRADSLAIIDLPNIYHPRAESSEYADPYERIGLAPAAIAADAKQYNPNSSYGCTYAPWVKIYDSLNDQSVWMPPSVVALGTMGSSEVASAVWFAPAGFNRGGLTEGSAGLPVTAVSQKLTSKERDALYEARVNPIASFPAEGIVVFGQKTLQIKASALDRINVRRMLNYVKKEISKIANNTLFEMNLQSTWTNFTAAADPFLASVQAGFGLQEYKLVLDATTTTPDLVDRNIMYAKVYLKPARAIEFIALDFIITNSGASFDD